MFQRQGMALERGMPVTQGGVPGVSRFRGQAEVGDSQFPNDIDLLVEPGQISLSPDLRMDKHQAEKHQVA